MRFHIGSSLVAIVACWVAAVGASDGDDLFIFDDCKYQCIQLTCYKNFDYKQDYRWDRDWEPDYRDHWVFDEIPLPYHLTLLGWDCESNCDYQCQRIVTDVRIEERNEIVQFYGKWPFRRIWGIQEFVSVLFSIGNLIPHYLGARKLLAVIRGTSATTAKTTVPWAYANVLVMSIITICAWAASTIFHVRDFTFTERLDYFLAGLTVLSGFHAAASRVFKLYLPQNKNKALALLFGCVAAYVAHVTRLLIDWSYTYNMQANIVVAILQNCCWCVLCYDLYSQFYYKAERQSQEASEKGDNVQTPDQSHLKYINPKRIILSSFFTTSPKLFSLYPLMLSTIVALGMSLEIFDFPPFFYDLIDAHALWHLVTIFPASYGLYDWIIWDIEENVISELNELEAAKNR